MQSLENVNNFRPAIVSFNKNVYRVNLEMRKTKIDAFIADYC